MIASAASSLAQPFLPDISPTTYDFPTRLQEEANSELTVTH
jgi:hypothetical protein